MMYEFEKFAHDMNELAMFKRMYKQSSNSKNLRLAFDDQFTWKRCILAEQMNRFVWLDQAGNENMTNWRNPVWKDINASSALLSKVILAYYRLAKEANSSNIKCIGEGLHKEFIPEEVFYA